LRSRISKIDYRLGNVLGGEPGFRRYWPQDFKKFDEKRRLYRCAIKAKKRRPPPSGQG